METREQMRPRLDAVPAHVPLDRVYRLNVFTDEGMRVDPFATIARQHARPDVFWNSAHPRFGGSWVLTRAALIREVLSDPVLFSSRGIAGFSQLVGESWRLVPLEIDPPEHTKFRKLMNPLFAPPAIAKLDAGVRRSAIELIDRFASQGGCEFVEAFGRPFPVGIFMQLMGLPSEDTESFLRWEFDLLHDISLPVKAAAAREILAYLRDLIAERRRRPAGDLVSFAIQAKIEDVPLTNDEIVGMCYLLFVGGLDTVASSLGFHFQHLATHPDDQLQLRRQPALIPRAVEEFLRRFSVVSTHRCVTRDTRLGGVEMKEGDWITIISSLGSLDDREFHKPFDVDPERKNNRHFGFAFGPHFCLGSHLARRELNIALEEWTQRVPLWRQKAAAPFEVHGGNVFGIERLELEW